MNRIIEMIVALTVAFTFVSAHATEFTSVAFDLDNRVTDGKRSAQESEAILTSSAWQSSVDAGTAVATVTHTAPGGAPETLHTTTSAGTEGFVWDASGAIPGDHVFTHTIRNGSTVLDTLTITFTVPEPTLNSIRVFGDAEVVSGHTASYLCMGYYSDSTGHEVTPTWSVVGTGASIDAQGTLLAGEVGEDTIVAVRAVMDIAGASYTNELAVTIQPPYLELSTDLVKPSKTAGEYSVGVTCSGAWYAEVDEDCTDWISLVVGDGEGDGALKFAVTKNMKAKTRTGWIYVTCGDLEWEVAVKQAVGEVETYVTVTFDLCGGTGYVTSKQYLVGSGYGSLPYPTYTGKIFGGWWTQSGGKGTRILASTLATSDVLTLYAYWREMDTAGALNGSLDWLEDETHPWVMDWTTSVDGNVSMRSAAIADDESSSLSLTVTGPGSIGFYWKASSEKKVDVLSFYCDGGKAKAKLSGETGWEHYNYDITDSNIHTLTWEYAKDEADSSGQDCAWLDSVTWMPAPPEVQTADISYNVPTAWLNQHGVSCTDADLEADSDGDGVPNWQEYVIGSDPNDPGSTFKAMIEIVDGAPVVRTVPNLGTYRTYTYEGKTNLTDSVWVTPTNESHKFFRVKVELNK